MKQLNDLGFKWHIPRKGRKIKQKSIPIIRRNENGEEVTGSDTSAEGQEVLAAGPGSANITSLGSPPIGFAALSEQSTQSNYFSEPSFAGLPNGAFVTTEQQLSAVPQAAAPPGMDLGTLLGLQNVLQILSSVNSGITVSGNTPWSNPPAPALPPPSNSTPLGSFLVSQPSNSLAGPSQVNFQQANGAQEPVALIIPLNSGDLHSFQQQQGFPPSLPMSSDPNTAAPGYVMNMPAPMSFAGASQPFFAMAPGNNPGQDAQTQMANQLLNALVAPTMQQPQLQHLQMQMQQQQNLQAQQQLVAMQQPQQPQGQMQQYQWQVQPQQQHAQPQPQQVQFGAQVNTASASQQMATQLLSLLGLANYSQIQVNAQQQQQQQQPQQLQGSSDQWPQPPPS
jgi:hypothetical protein